MKNFSYCKVAYSSYKSPAPIISEWNHLDLHKKFGDKYALRTGDPESLFDSKAYLAQLAVAVVDNVLMDPEWVPHVITIENQRTRSNTNSATIPNVLLNYTLEHMIYAAFAARQQENPNFSKTTVVPMNSNKMVNFWISRWVDNPRVSALRSKRIRTALLWGWLSDPAKSPFDFKDLMSHLPAEFAELKTSAKTQAVLKSLQFDVCPKKSDDLVDCLLYNLAFIKQLQHHDQLKNCPDEGLVDLVHLWDVEHCNYIAPLLEEFNLTLSLEYSPET